MEYNIRVGNMNLDNILTHYIRKPYYNPVLTIKIYNRTYNFMETKIILIRHGQSIGNQTRTFLGHTDLDLSELGYLQAKCTASALKNEKIDLIFSSDLKRAYNTVKFLADDRGLKVIPDVRLREAYAGEWENQNVDELIDKWGSDFFVNQWKNRFGTFVLPGGESIKAAGERFYRAILDISVKNQGKTILIGSHAAVIRSFWSIINKVDWEDTARLIPFATNASYSIATYSDGEITPVLYSFDEHLSEVGITKVNLI